MEHRKVNNYEFQAEAARSVFLKWDQSKLARRNGIETDNDYIYISFFQEKYSVNRHTGEILRGNEGAPVDYNAVMVIYDVLCNSKPGAALSMQWQLLENLNPHSNFGSMEKSLFSPAAEFFSGKVELLKKACSNLGGFETKKSDAGFMFNVFPFLPMMLQFWDGDEEFAPKVSFLFDKNTPDFLCFESSWYTVAHLIEIVRAEMDMEFSMGFYGR